MPTHRPDPPTPRHPASPRFDDLTNRASLGPSDVGEDAVVRQLHLADVFLDEHHADYAELHQLRLDGGSIAGSHWHKATVSDWDAIGVDAANTVFVESALHRTRWDRCRLTGLTLAWCTLTDADFTGCVLDLANLRMASLRRVRFTDCRMSGIDLSHARLEDVRFDGCQLTEAQLRQSRHSRVAISGCELTGLKGVGSLRGVTVDPVDLLEFTAQLATELGIRFGGPT